MLGRHIVRTQLSQKIHILGYSPKAQKIVGHTSPTDLIKKIVCDGSESKTKRIQSKISKENVIPPVYEEELGKLCRFSISHPSWLSGTSEQFETYYERDTDRKTGVPLEVDTSVRPEPVLKDLAVLEATIGQTSPGEPVPVILELICGREIISDNDRLVVKRGFYRLILGEARSPDKRSWLGADGAYQNEKKTYFIQAIPSDSAEPRWELWTEEGYLGMVLPTDEHCKIEGLAHGDTVKAVFETYPKDQCLQLENGENFSSVKEAFLQRIAQKADFKTDDDLLVLCTHELRFREVMPLKGDGDEL